MSQYAKRRNARVDLTNTGAVFCSPVVFEFEGKNGTNSTDHNGMKQAGQLCPIYARIQNVAPATNPLCRLFILKNG